MSIFGEEKVINNFGGRYVDYFNQENAKRLQEIKRLERNINDNSPIITIFAESKGSLAINEIFSFGNGGKDINTGYVVMYPMKVLGIGVSSSRGSGDINIGVVYNGVEMRGYDITVPENNRSRDIRFDDYFEVLPGRTINFINKKINSTTINTVACLLLKLI